MNQERYGSALVTLLSTVAIAVVGWLALISATHTNQAQQAGKQVVFLLVGFGFACFLSSCDYRRFRAWAHIPYVVTLGLLGLVLVAGASRNGAQRWIDLGFMLLQPSEFAKLALVLSLSKMLADASENWEQPRRPYIMTIKCGILAAFSIFLIAAQPDLGTALVLVAILYVMLFCFGGSIILLLGSVTAVLAIGPQYLKDYQMQRIMTFLNPESDPLGVGYNLAQAKAAVSSGGIWGLGLFHGPLTQSHYVPEAETDFIFTVVGEEFGLIGTTGLLGLFLILLLSTLYTAAKCPDRFGASLSLGVATLLAFHILVNVAMVLGMAPVVGLPLPFCSYGGSSMLASMAGVGLVASVARATGLSQTRYREGEARESA